MILVGINLVYCRNMASNLADILSWVSMVWLILRILDLIFKRAENYASNNHHPERLSVLNLLRKVVKLILIAIATIVILGNLGRLNHRYCRIRVGGVALALGAQKRLKTWSAVYRSLLTSLSKCGRLLPFWHARRYG